MREASKLPQPSVVDIDPEDPSQQLDDAGQFNVAPLEVEAQPSAEADADLDAAVFDAASELDTPSQTTADAYAEAAQDTGELYGVRTPHATDRDLADSVDSEEGENWLETLEKNAAEYGAEAEEELAVIDDSDEHRGHHSSDRRDRPVADKGSGGDGGL